MKKSKLLKYVENMGRGGKKKLRVIHKWNDLGLN